MYLTVGRIGKPYGIKGFVKIHSFTEPAINFLDYSPWFVFLNASAPSASPAVDNNLCLNLINCKLHGNCLIGQIEGCLTPEKARQYTLLSISVLQEKLPSLDERQFYWHSLIGLGVYNLQGVYLGKIDNLLETGANNVLIIKKTSQKQILIPFVMSQFIKNIDQDNQKMQVDWQEDWL